MEASCREAAITLSMYSRLSLSLYLSLIASYSNMDRCSIPPRPKLYLQPNQLCLRTALSIRAMVGMMGRDKLVKKLPKQPNQREKKGLTVGVRRIVVPLLLTVKALLSASHVRPLRPLGSTLDRLDRAGVLAVTASLCTSSVEVRTVLH